MRQPEGVEELRSVRDVVEYHGNHADCSALLNEANTQEVRVYFLQNLRDNWQWVDDHTSERHENGFVQFKRK